MSKLGTPLDSPCVHCNGIILWGSSYRRFYCSKQCYDNSHEERICGRCGELYVPRRGTQFLCNDCTGKIYSGVDTNHELFPTYNAMIQRCYNNRRNNYHHYGNRGIRVCDSWLDGFDNFLRDMGARPYGMTLDRIDNDLGYSPDNCRWVTIEEQRINRGRFKNATTKYKGVGMRKKSKSINYSSTVRYKNKSYYLGVFDTQEAAAEAYNEKIKEFYPDNWEMYINKIEYGVDDENKNN